jgi:putative flippase GtrA
MTAAPPEDEEPRPGALLKLFRYRRVAFLIVGGANTAIGFALFIVIELVWGGTLDSAIGPVFASVVVLLASHVIAVLIAFALYRRFVFRVSGHVLRDLVRFESVYLVSIAINVVSLPLLVQFGVNRIVAQALILLVTTVLSYFGHSRFSFVRHPRGQGKNQADGQT